MEIDKIKSPSLNDLARRWPDCLEEILKGATIEAQDEFFDLSSQGWNNLYWTVAEYQQGTVRIRARSVDSDFDTYEAKVMYSRPGETDLEVWYPPNPQDVFTVLRDRYQQQQKELQQKTGPERPKATPWNQPVGWDV